MAAGLVVLVVLVGIGLVVPSGAPAHSLWAATMGTPAQVQADTPAAAIQSVIQQADQEQTQALATGSPSVMSDTATAAYYRQLAQINQSLIDGGVTSISLSQLAWGPISVNGSTATATTTETWLTTFSDGTTAESTDTNVYTLVQQGGAWLIEADQQAAPASGQATPATAAAPGASGQTGQVPTPARPASPAPSPALSVGQNASQNWSGYMAVGHGSYTGVTGTWTVPQPIAGGGAGVGATWVGIGGVRGRDLIQAGTQDMAAGGQDQFQTWIELLPQASQQVPVAVAPGDSVTVSIDEQGAGTGVWQISITNNTSGQSYQTTVSYASSESSADWIEEAPASSNGLLPLDNFGSVSFSAATAMVNGQTVGLAQAGAQPITMVNAGDQALAVPSAIDSNGSSFTVTRTSAPATTPRTARGGGRGRRPGRALPGTTTN